ncbi:MAG TPA: hypothetical protein VGM23_18020 [Armatimonadota bacterium]
MQSTYVTLGKRRVKDEYTDEHCRRLMQWYTPDGEYIRGCYPADTRERMWACLSLLAHPDPRYIPLAEQIILRTPIDHNHFQPFAAVEVLLRFRQKLSAPAVAYLTEIVSAHLLNSMEVRFAGPGVNNFTCMSTWFLLAAAQALDGYRWEHPLASIPEVYSKERLIEIGRNALHALAYCAEHQPLISEWNAPGYTAISIYCLAKIVELIDDPVAKEVALQVEMTIWRQMLQLYHPALDVCCGPYARAYRHEMLGQFTQMRLLLAYTGLSKDRSLLTIFDQSQHGRQSAYDPDIAFNWAGIAWIIAGPCHVPADAIDELRNRTYPHRFTAPISWNPFGAITPEGKYLSVQGNALPGGAGEIVQVQHPNWAIGYRTQATLGHSFPLHLHYALKTKVQSLRDNRHVTAAVYFHNAPTEWIPGPDGTPMESTNFNKEGDVRVREAGDLLAFTARPFHQFAPIPSNEQSVNTFLPIHFTPLQWVEVNGKRYRGEEIRLHGRTAVCRVRDAGFEYEITYAFPKAVDIRLYQWGNFLRFAAFFYSGETRNFTADELKKLKMQGSVRIVKTP